MGPYGAIASREQIELRYPPLALPVWLVCPRITPTENPPEIWELGNSWPPYRIGKHSNPQNMTKIDQKYTKKDLLCIWCMFALFCLWGPFVFCRGSSFSQFESSTCRCTRAILGGAARFSCHTPKNVVQKLVHCHSVLRQKPCRDWATKGPCQITEKLEERKSVPGKLIKDPVSWSNAPWHDYSSRSKLTVPQHHKQSVTTGNDLEESCGHPTEHPQNPLPTGVIGEQVGRTMEMSGGSAAWKLALGSLAAARSGNKGAGRLPGVTWGITFVVQWNLRPTMLSFEETLYPERTSSKTAPPTYPFLYGAMPFLWTIIFQQNHPTERLWGWDPNWEILTDFSLSLSTEDKTRTFQTCTLFSANWCCQIGRLVLPNHLSLLTLTLSVAWALHVTWSEQSRGAGRVTGWRGIKEQSAHSKSAKLGDASLRWHVLLHRTMSIARFQGLRNSRALIWEKCVKPCVQTSFYGPPKKPLKQTTFAVRCASQKTAFAMPCIFVGICTLIAEICCDTDHDASSIASAMSRCGELSAQSKGAHASPAESMT